MSKYSEYHSLKKSYNQFDYDVFIRIYIYIYITYTYTYRYKTGVNIVNRFIIIKKKIVLSFGIPIFLTKFYATNDICITILTLIG